MSEFGDPRRSQTAATVSRDIKGRILGYLVVVARLGCRLPESFQERLKPRIRPERFEVLVFDRNFVVSCKAMIDRPLQIRQRFLTLAPEGVQTGEVCHGQGR